MPAVSVNGCRLHYRFDGPEAAPVLLLSNSLGTTLGMWEDQMPDFTRTFRVLRYDSRGHGASEATSGAYTIEQLGRDAFELLGALSIRRAHVCGLSKGGMVAMWLATWAPEVVDRVVLCNTSAALGPPSRWDERIQAVTSLGMSSVAEAVLERWFTPGFRASAPAAVERFRRMLLTTPADGYAGCCAAIRDMDQTESIGRISRPTLVVVGSQDPATPPEHGERIASRVPGARLVALPAAHLSNVESAQEFNRTVAAFLEG
jgi:3-oxoadipate enol-lactonase